MCIEDVNMCGFDVILSCKIIKRTVRTPHSILYVNNY